MGSTYHNTIVQGPTQTQIVASLTDQHDAALVSPALNDLTVVYTPATVWTASAAHLSRTLHCAALFSSVYDGAYFEYRLYEDGQLVDHYNDHTFSYDPYGEPVFDQEGGYVEPAMWWGPTGGDTRRLCRAFGVDARVDRVEAILHPSDAGRIEDWDVEALEHHAALAEAMGWPLSACFSDYDQLKRDGIDADLVQEFAGSPVIETSGDNDTCYGRQIEWM